MIDGYDMTNGPEVVEYRRLSGDVMRVVRVYLDLVEPDNCRVVAWIVDNDMRHLKEPLSLSLREIMAFVTDAITTARTSRSGV